MRKLAVVAASAVLERPLRAVAHASSATGGEDGVRKLQALHSTSKKARAS
jgi:hypothetical protein